MVLALVWATGCGSPAVARLADVPPLHPEVDRLPSAVVTIDTHRGHVDVRVRVASEPAQRQRGLQGVTELPAGTGMLFVFDGERRGGFWMRDTLVPLDIAFVGASGEIVSILTMQPCEAADCPIYDPGLAYTSAIEVPAGWLATVGATVGDPVRVGARSEP